MLKKQNTGLLSLLFSKQFHPLFLVQFLGAFNDNLFKNALVMLITFRLTDTATDTGLLITLAAGLFILPFFVFSSLAGQLADNYSKTMLLKKIKLAEVLVMGLGAIALLNQSVSLLLFTLFLMGTQSAFFGPIKYAILPEILEQKLLVQGNSLFSGSTFIAILLGTIAGGVGILAEGGLEIMAISVLIVAILGYLLSLVIKSLAAANPDLIINWNPVSSTWNMLRNAFDYSISIKAVVGISWFWFIGATLLSQIPALVKYNMFASDQVVVVFLTLFSVGIAIGSGLASRLMLKRVHVNWHWIILLLMSFSILLTVWSVSSLSSHLELVSRETSEPVYGTMQLLSIWPVNLSFLGMGLLAVLGGLYIVPLYTLLQTYTPLSVRARMVAVNNIVNALLMVVSAILIMIGFAIGLSLLQMLMMLVVMNFIVVAWFWFNRQLVLK
jgi:acyl-[acyl-carrier-protein]-phospholipid O-acyltransferase/long-chain-fatty-acid--[acyl-carrier-protein] ligase